MEKYRVEVADIEYYRRQIPCQYACPVHTDARGYVNAIADGDFEQGYIIARQPNPFASTCGRVCNAACEAACRRGKIDTPVAIRPLKRFLTEKYGVEGLTRLPIARAPGMKMGASLLEGPAPGNSATVEAAATLARMSSLRVLKRKAKVAVIGAGPAGLSCARDLNALGYQVALFEATSVVGGMLRLGVPGYRLPRELIRVETEDVLRQGIELKLNARLGRDFYFDTLREQGYEAILVAIGSHKERDLGVEGQDLDGILKAVDFLLNVNMGYRVELGERVLVVGGGGVAIDAARMARRLGPAELPPYEGDGVMGIEVAREALRLGVKEVHILYRGMREEMKADAEEIQDALDEGVQLHLGKAPKRVLSQGGKVIGLETISVTSSRDREGRRVLTLAPGTEEVLLGDTIVVAIGQESDLSFLREGDGIEVTRQGGILVDPATLATTAPGVFAGGDVAFGPRFIIEAVRDGHTAARSIDQYLQGKRSRIVRQGWMTVIPPEKLPPTARLQVQRQRPPVLTVERRIGITEVELGYSEKMAREQADRCLRCHIQTVFNGDLCIFCGGCADVCPMNCLKLVSLGELHGDTRVEAMVQAKFGAPLEAFSVAGGAVGVLGKGSAIIKDETQCIRCGLCARRCPTGAITMEGFSFTEGIVYDESEVVGAGMASGR